MEKLLETLAEIEEKANRIMDHAHSYKSTLDQEKKEKLQQLEEESKKNLDEKVATLKAKTDSEIAKSNEKLQADTEKQLNALKLRSALRLRENLATFLKMLNTMLLKTSNLLSKAKF